MLTINYVLYKVNRISESEREIPAYSARFMDMLSDSMLLPWAISHSGVTRLQLLVANQ